jgi:2-deoxy-D-gluconate 3-dehydrogenase
MANPFDLSGKVAVVTGANTGIGQAIALALAEAGADVACVGRTPAEETVDRARALGRNAEIVSADLSSIEPVQRVVDETVAKLGGLDILVNNAGIIRRADAVDFTEEDWDAVVDTNLKSVFFLCQAAGRHMIARREQGGGGGKIINIASMLTFQGGVRVSSYTASKSGVGGLTKLLANEWASQNVNVNAIAPGYIATNNTTLLRADDARNKAIVDRIPAGRWGDASDLGGAAVFLASSAADYVHGHILAVDGGWLAR